MQTSCEKSLLRSFAHGAWINNDKILVYQCLISGLSNLSFLEHHTNSEALWIITTINMKFQRFSHFELEIYPCQ